MALTKTDKKDIGEIVGEMITENNKILLESVEGVITQQVTSMKAVFKN